MFFLPQSELLFFFSKSVPRRALKQVLAFSTVSVDHFSDSHISVRNAWNVICKYDGNDF